MNGGKVLSVAILVLMLVVVSTRTPTPARANNVEGNVYDRVMRTGELRCGYALWPGLVDKNPNTGALSGAFYDYVEALGQSLQLKVRWVEEVDFGAIVEELQSGKVDAICSGAWTNPIRGKFVDFTTPMAFQATRPYVRANDKRFDTNLDKINDSSVTISVVDGESAATIAQEDFPKAKLLSMPAGTAMTQMLLNVMHGKADIAFADPGLAGEFMAHNPGTLRPVDSAFPLRVFGVPISLKKGETELKETLDNATRQLLGTGAIEKILKRHEKYSGMYLRVRLPFEFRQ